MSRHGLPTLPFALVDKWPAQTKRGKTIKLAPYRGRSLGPSQRRGPIIAWVIVGAFSIYTAIAAFRTPYYNWDVIAYLATIFYFDTKDEIETHQRTMARILPLPNHAVLCNAQSHYSKTICTDASALRAQLNFYLVRPLYLAVVYGLYKLHGDPLFALVVVSVASGFVLSLVAAYLTFLKIGWIGVSLTPLVLSFSGIVGVSQLQTPDALCALVVFSAALLFLAACWRTSLCVLLGAILIRPDTILFFFLLATYCFIFSEKHKREVLFFVLVAFTAVALYGAVNHFAGHYGWGITLKHTVEPFPYPEKEIAPIASFGEYFAILTFATQLQFFSRPIDILTLYALIAGLVGFLMLKKEVLYRDFSLLCVVYIVFHYLIFPAFFTRFFVAHNILLYICFLYGLAHYFPALYREETFSLPETVS